MFTAEPLERYAKTPRDIDVDRILQIISREHFMNPLGSIGIFPEIDDLIE